MADAIMINGIGLKNVLTGDFSQFDCMGGTGTQYAYFKLPDDNKDYIISVTAKENILTNLPVYIGLTANGGDASGGFAWAWANTTANIGRGGVASSKSGHRFVSLSPFSANSLSLLLEKCDVEILEIV